MSVLIGLWLAKPATATSPTIIRVPEDYTSGTMVIKDGAIQQPISLPEPSRVRPTIGKNTGTSSPSISGRHTTRAERTISEGQLRQWLENKRSPLAPYTESILHSDYWSTIIGICTIEQYGCTRLPGGKNWNLWGIGGSSGLRYYSTPEEAIQAISELLAKYETRGYDTIEALNCYYVQPCSQAWYNTVLKTKTTLENL